LLLVLLLWLLLLLLLLMLVLVVAQRGFEGPMVTTTFWNRYYNWLECCTYIPWEFHVRSSCQGHVIYISMSSRS
jgi:ABC-type antimicrobial peptide transport system permease subunit